MASWRRFEALTGQRIEELDNAGIERLVAQRVREDSDLEFKEVLYGASDADKRELVADIAALANGVGGILVLGIREEDGAAAALSPVDLSDQAELTMRH